MRDLQLAIEEIGLSGSVSLGNCSVRTLQRWCKDINEILETRKYDWRICVDKDNMCLKIKEELV